VHKSVFPFLSIYATFPFLLEYFHCKQEQFTLALELTVTWISSVC